MPKPFEEIGKRLEMLRIALDLTQKGIAESAGMTESQYNHFARGNREIKPKYAIALAERYGVTTDWIYRGVVAQLPHELHEKLYRAA